MRFIYWNLNKKDLAADLVSLAIRHQPDFLILSEAQLDIPGLLLQLNTGQKLKYGLVASTIDDPVILTTLQVGTVQDVLDSSGMSIKVVRPPTGPEFLLGAVHLPSKLHRERDDQTLLSSQLASLIVESEDQIKHDRTILVGDFNMNPFEPGLVGAAAFHAVMSKAIASKGSRTVDGKKRPFFYNPMWSHFGDYPDPTAGTYFYPNSGQVCYFWNMFDQLLIRASLLEYFLQESLSILTSIDGKSLLTQNGTPNQTLYSDHLPIHFELDFTKGLYS